MKKINLKNINLKADWQKTLVFTTSVSVLIFAVFVSYLFIKPADKGIKAIIDNEISETNITFDQKTLEILKKRQEPTSSIAAPSGKNPFAPF